MSLIIISLSALLLLIAYRVYGSALEKWWGVDPSQITPAHRLRDGIDYVPANRAVLMGHHFASIAGAAPIIGPIIAVSFGWVPVLIWVIVAGIFFGAVHDFGALFVSIRHNGSNLSQIIEQYMGKNCRNLFLLFIWFTSILVIAAFSSIVADTFVASPSAASSSVSFIFLALIFGYAVNRRQLKILPATLGGIVMLAACIIFGQAFPLELSHNIWIIAILIYITISSVTPIWMLLQPRDYLNSFLLYVLIIGAFSGFILVRPDIELPAFTSFIIDDQPLFPFMFLIVACGAISGFHSMFASVTTSKQVNNEADMKPVAFGGMLIESFLAILAIFIAASFIQNDYSEMLASGGPVVIFSRGLSGFAHQLGLNQDTVSNLVILTIASFALTSLDSVTRVARCVFQDTVTACVPPRCRRTRAKLGAKIPASILTAALGGILAFRGWNTVWPVFGAANQLIASFTFITLFLWFRHSKRAYRMTVIPMIFMFMVTMTGLIIMLYSGFKSGQFVLPVIALLLTLLGILFAKRTAAIWKKH